ncbi:DUF5606 family protein [Parafilimonas terrae]|uniref:Uncharacterized protein n=1 Tax=Parafilimonas terrae TaxID=1465490 RepID=A0A1I5ZEU1_9BACT|nr:DUF5606 domain-containing protein [Parafilimonas terrae]SFQ54903.1 hypothetical protein SAMN05444277_12113 [Parafilimonas terrae]
MEYSKLISVTGLPGLFELVASKNDGAIVRSLDDKATKFVSSRVHNFSHLESIEVYTEGDNVNLADVFLAMQNSSEALPNEKDAAAVKKYFEKVYPTMDFDRVYASDMKKMVKWFDVLSKNNIEIKVSEEVPEGDEEETGETPDPNKQPEEKPKVEEPVATPAVEAKPKKAKAAKAKKEEVEGEGAATESKPKAAKKAANK